MSRLALTIFLALVCGAMTACTGSPHRDWYIAAGTFTATANAIADAAEDGAIPPETVRDHVLPRADEAAAALDAAYILLPESPGDPIDPSNRSAFEENLAVVRATLEIIRAVLTAGDHE